MITRRPAESVTDLTGEVAELTTRLSVPINTRPDIEACLALVYRMRITLNRIELDLIRAARGNEVKWATIARWIGCPNRQAALQRYRRLIEWARRTAS